MNDITAAIKELFPTSLDNIIRTNRHLAQLRLASDEEITALTGKVVFSSIKDDISDYRLVSIVIKDPDSVSVHLLGTCSAGRSWTTSPIIVLDMERGYAATRSGSVYRLVGPLARDEPGSNDLIHLCATMNGWGLGSFLGIPTFFY